MHGFTIVAGTGEGQFLRNESRSSSLGNGGLEGLGRRPEEKRPLDVTGPCHQLTGGVNDGNGTVVKRLDESRADLLGEHGTVLRGVQGRIAQIVLVPGDDLGVEPIKDRLDLHPGGGEFGFNFSQLHRSLGKFLGGQLGKANHEIAPQNSIHVSPTPHRKRWQLRGQMTGGSTARSLPTDEDFWQRLYQAPMLFPPTPPLFESEQVEPTMEKPSVVGQLRLDLIGEVTTTSELVQIKRFRICAEVRGEDLIQSSVFLGGIVGHVREVTGRR